MSLVFARRSGFRIGVWAGLGLFIMGCAVATGQAVLKPVLPTPNDAIFRNAPVEAFIQPTAGGQVESGLFGCVRSAGQQFHEGIDLKPVERDRRGEAADPVFAIMAGKVVHIATNPGQSSYGRYVVLEHPATRPAMLSLYAHLAAIDPGLRLGQTVKAGAVLGLMGRSAGGYTIPRDRAHLHLEVALRLSDRFQTWYDRQGYGSRNYHGNYNGMNLAGFDPLRFLRATRAKPYPTLGTYLDEVPSAVRFRVRQASVPDFVRRYPDLLTNPNKSLLPAGWDIEITAEGLPIRWTALGAEAFPTGKEDRVAVTWHDLALRNGASCRDLVEWKSSRPRPGRYSIQLLSLLFGFSFR